MKAKSFCLLTAALACLMISPSYGQNLPVNVIDEVHNRVKTAANAAALILKADFHRREAERFRQSGQLGDARSELQAAEDIITSATSRDESLQSDALLRDYFGQLHSALLALKTPIMVPESFQGANPIDRINTAYPFIRKVLAGYELPQRLAAVVAVESAGSASALSPKGARGLWQLMPDTARRYGLRVNDQVDERLDPVKSTYAAARYLRDLYSMFQEWPLTLAAYNAGEDRIQSLIERTGIQRFEEMAHRRLLPAETIHYVPAVLDLMRSTVSDRDP